MPLNWLDLLENLVMTAVAAFGGAWFAFLFERRREEKRQQDDEYRAIRFAHFVVTSQYSELLSLGESQLEKCSDRDKAWWQLKPLLQGFAAPGLNLSALAFTFEGPDPDLLNRLTVGQQRFETVRHLISLRNEAYVELQRRAVALQAKGQDPAPGGEEFQNLVGRELVRRLKDTTNGLLDEHQSAQSLLKSNLDSITAAVAVRFPQKRLPQVTFVPKEQRI